MTHSRLEPITATSGPFLTLRGGSWLLLSAALGMIALNVSPMHALAQEPSAYAFPPPSYAPTAPPPPIARVEVEAPEVPPVDGQWVHTNQYGWIWMPYDQAYTRVFDDREPSMYVYGSTFGWRWVAAPWVFNAGPEPYWGDRGRAYFAWHSRPWFARRDYRSAPFRGPTTVVVHDRRPEVVRENRTIVIHEHRPPVIEERRPAYVQDVRAMYHRDSRPENRSRVESWGSHHEQPSFRRDYHRDGSDMRDEHHHDGRPSFGGGSRRIEAPAAHGGERREAGRRGPPGHEFHEHGHSHGRR